MRLIGSLVVACLVLIGQPAAAQQQTPPPSAQTTIAPSHLSAAREMLQAMLIDSDILEDMSLEAFRLVTPQINSQLTNSPFYASLTPAHQRALLAYLEGFPTIGQEESMAGSSDLLDRFAPQMASHFTENELNDITAFIRTPEGHSVFYRSVLEGVRSAARGESAATEPEQTDAETAALLRFSLTPGGAAFNARANTISPMMREIGQASTGSPRVVARLQRDVCAVLEDQCPAQLRSN